jgi:phosphoserine phosphatase RsbU/P
LISDNRKLQIRILSVVCAVVISYGCFWFYGKKFETWNLQMTDHLFLLAPKAGPHTAPDASPVVLVDSNFYYQRSHHAKVIRNLSEMDVSAQIIDFIFKDRVGNTEDNALIDATDEAGNVYFGMAFAALSDSHTNAGITSDPKDIGYLGTITWPVAVDGNPDSFYTGNTPEITYPGLSAASKGIGFMNLKPDPDGILRRVPLLVRYRDAFYPSLPFRVLCDHLYVSPEQIIVKPGEAIILKKARTGGQEWTTDIVIPTDRHGNMLLNYNTVHAQPKRFSFSRIFQASEKPSDMVRLKKAFLRKIVFLSETVEKPYKIRSKEGESLLPTVAVHSAVIQTILAGSFLKLLPNGFTLLIQGVLLGALLLLSIRFSSVPLAIGVFSMGTGYVLIGMLFLFYAGVVFQFLQPLFLLFLGLSSLLVGMGIEKAMVFAETEKARRIAEHELEIGRQIQTGFFPTNLPRVHGWELDVYFQAARYVAGDFYDVFTLGRKKRLGIVIADVCDKGVGAALFMALFRSFIRVLSGRATSENHLGNDGDPMAVLSETVRAINNYISITHERDGMFATLFYGIIDTETGELFYINGGHEPPLIIGPKGIRSRLSPTGPAVGLYPDLNHSVKTARLEPDDTLLVLTDGVTDARNRADQIFSKNRLEAMCIEPFLSTGDLTNRIEHRINAHIAGTEQFDDITVLALKRKS